MSFNNSSSLYWMLGILVVGIAVLAEPYLHGQRSPSLQQRRLDAFDDGDEIVSHLVVKGPYSVLPSECAAYEVSRVTLAGEILTWRESRKLHFTPTATAGVFKDRECTERISELELAANTATTTYYFKDDSPEGEAGMRIVVGLRESQLSQKSHDLAAASEVRPQ